MTGNARTLKKWTEDGNYHLKTCQESQEKEEEKIFLSVCDAMI